MKFSVSEMCAIVAGLKLLQYGLEKKPGFYPVTEQGTDEISREYHENFQSIPLTADEIAEMIINIEG